MRYLNGCGISPLHHRFTPKVMSKGVSEMLWKCRSRKRCHHITSETSRTMDHDGSSWQVGKSTLKDFARLSSSLHLASLCLNSTPIVSVSGCVTMYETVQTAPWGTKQIQNIKHATSRRHSFWFQQWSDTCDTSLAVESALCTTGSPRRWCQRVSRKCYESVGAAKGVITSPLKHQGPWIMMDHHDKSASQLWRT